MADATAPNTETTTPPTVPEEKEAWTTAYVDELPDSSFLHVEGGGSKDAEGKTTPRSLRHFPVKDKNGKVDLDHVRNALSRIPQSSLSQDVKDKAKAEAERMLSSAEKRAVVKQVRKALDGRVKKVEGFTFDQVTAAVTEALCDKYPTPEDGDRWMDGPWIRDIFDESVVFTYEGVLLSMPYTFTNGTATLSGEAVPVKVVYQPIEGAAAPGPDADELAANGGAPSLPNAEAGKRYLQNELFGKASKNADAAIEALSKRATPPKVEPKKAPFWPADMSPSGKRNVLGRR